MQHLDEGIIHSWLDGALSAEDAARVSAHVEECAQCGGAVAEARGFIAASSRILTALDNVPKGVVPVAAAVKPRNWATWRAAAAVLVVALGSFAVLKERMGTPSTAADVIPFRVQNTMTAAADSTSVEGVQPDSPPAEAPTSARAQAKAAMPPHTVTPAVTGKIGNQETPKRQNAAALAATPQPLAVASDAGREAGQNNARLESAGAANMRVDAGAARAYGGKVAEDQSGRIGGVASSAPVVATAMSDSVARVTPIRVVGNPRMIGEKRTLYEIAPGDTVLLAEALRMELNSVVVTALGATRTAQSADTSSQRIKIRGASAKPVAPDSQRNSTALRPAAASAVASAPPPPSVETLNGVTTLTWTDLQSGNAMKLSGRHTYAELLEIRRRIEQFRAAEAAAKKTK